MLNSNSIRFCSDTFDVIEADVDEGGSGAVVDNSVSYVYQALLITKSKSDGTGGGWYLKNVSEVTKFLLDGYTVDDVTTGACSEPANTRVRFVFKVREAGSNELKDKIFLNGNLVDFGHSITTENILDYGNDITTLRGLSATSLTNALSGARVLPVIALGAKSNATVMPVASIGIEYKKSSTELSSDEYETLEYQLTDGDELPTITGINANVGHDGNGAIDLKVSIQNAAGVWSNYMALERAVDQPARAVKFKYVLSVTTTDGTDAVRLKNLIVSYANAQSGMTSNGVANLFSNVVDYEIPLQRCYLIVRHDPLNDSEIQAFVNFMHKPKHREMILLGKGNGGEKEFFLGVSVNSSLNADKGVDCSSLKLYSNGSEIPSDNISVNSEVSTVYVTGTTNGVPIYASYDYDHDTEVWRRMKLESTEKFNPDIGACTSYYSYTLPDDEAEDKTISNVRLRFRRPTGIVTNQKLGTAVGNKVQTFVLDHIPKESTIEFSDSTVSGKYDADSGVINVTGKKGRPIVISYEWKGEPVFVHSYSAGWSVA